MFRFGALIATLLLGSALVSAQTDKKPAKKTEAAPAPSGQRRVLYKPAPGSAPAARVTGGSRGSGNSSVRLDVLAPDEVGLTTEEQPSLFWYQSQAAPVRFELTLLQPNKARPLMEVNEPAAEAGIQRVKLSEHNVKLQVGVEYQWVAALILDPANRSKDLVASGFIKRVEPSKELQAKLAKASAEELPAIYAEAGIWHEALSRLSDLVEAHPDDPTWRQQRADLLGQVKLAAATDSPGAHAKK